METRHLQRKLSRVTEESEQRSQTVIEPTSPGPHKNLVLISPGPYAIIAWQDSRGAGGP